MKIDLPFETWRVLHTMLLDAPAPARVSFPAIREFEEAMREAQQPPAALGGEVLPGDSG